MTEKDREGMRPSDFHKITGEKHSHRGKHRGSRCLGIDWYEAVRKARIRVGQTLRGRTSD